MKLVYFDARGRVEPIRIVLAYAGVQYEDERISFEKWPELKPSKFYAEYCQEQLHVMAGIWLFDRALNSFIWVSGFRS